MMNPEESSRLHGLEGVVTGTAPVDAAGSRERPGGLLFDFTEVGTIDLPTLSLLFTAHVGLGDEHGAIWVAGLPLHFWQFLSAMGLEGYFRPFPGHARIQA